MPATKSTKKSKVEKPRQPDDVVRESAGIYRSTDDRFEVRQSQANWYLVDTQQANEFGQELIHGPFGSLKQAQAAMTGAREVKPLLRSAPRPKSTRSRKPKEPPKPESWIDRLPKAEAGTVKRLIKALEREGVADAEGLVRRSRETERPLIAAAVIERRLNDLVDKLPEEDRDAARSLIRKQARILTEEGAASFSPLPRWALVELGEGETAARPIRLRR